MGLVFHNKQVYIVHKNNMSLKNIPTVTLPMGYAEQVLDLEMRLQEEQSLELIQILSQMYRIAVEYYLQIDIKKANYFQKKLNSLVVKSLNAPSIEKIEPKKENLSKTIKSQMQKFMECKQTYVKSIVERSEKTQKKIAEYVKADLNKQEQLFQHRMLKRVKSTGRLA